MTKVQLVPSDVLTLTFDPARRALMLHAYGKCVAVLDSKPTPESIEALLHRFACTTYPNGLCIPYDTVTDWGLVFTGKKVESVDVSELSHAAVLEIIDGDLHADGAKVLLTTPGVETFQALYRNGFFKEAHQ